MMKKFFLIFSLIIFLPFVTAQEITLDVEPELETAGVGPDMPLFWWVDQFLEKIQLRLVKAEFRYETRLKHAEERLAETKAMLEKKKLKAMEKAQTKYVEEVEEIQTEIKGMPEATKTKVILNLQKHVTVLQSVREKHLGGEGLYVDAYTRGIDQALEVGQRNIEKFKEKVYKIQ